MRFLLAPLVGAFLFLGGCMTTGQGVNAPSLSVEQPPPVHHTHKPKPKAHVAAQKHTSPAPAPTVVPQIIVPPEPAPVQVAPAPQPTLSAKPPAAPPAFPWRGLLNAIGIVALVGVALALVVGFLITFIRGFRAARKGQA